LCLFLLFDGHGSQFDLEFLEYINSEETKWNVTIGLPYRTSHWQVGDSTEQNGCFKMALAKQSKLWQQQQNKTIPAYILRLTKQILLNWLRTLGRRAATKLKSCVAKRMGN